MDAASRMPADFAVARLEDMYARMVSAQNVLDKRHFQKGVAEYERHKSKN